MRTNLYPGSEISGVPASEIRLTIFPSIINFFIRLRNEPSLLSLYTFKEALMPCFASNLLETLVSSQSTISELLSTSSARNVISLKFPIGVEIT